MAQGENKRSATDLASRRWRLFFCPVQCVFHLAECSQSRVKSRMDRPADVPADALAVEGIAIVLVLLYSGVPKA
jgi:hypothetical protein